MGTIDRKFAKVLCHLIREEKRLKQAEVVRETGLPQSTVSAIMNGTRGVDRERRELIAKCFGMTVDGFLSYLDKDTKKHSEELIETSYENNITALHQDIVQKFKDKDEGYAANKALLAIEELDEFVFLDVVKDLKKIAKHLKITKETGEKPKPNDFKLDKASNLD